MIGVAGLDRDVDLAVPAVGDRAPVRPSRSRRWPRPRPRTAGASSAPRSSSKNLQVLASQGPGTGRAALRRAAVADARQHPRSRARGLVRARARQGQPRLHAVGAGQHRGQGLRAARRARSCCRASSGSASRATCPSAPATSCAARSDAIAQLIADETQAAAGAGAAGPAGRCSRTSATCSRTSARLSSGCSSPTLTDYYERRQWNEIERFESYSTGAHAGGVAGAGGGAHRRVRHRDGGEEARRVPRAADAVAVEVPDRARPATPSARASSSR